MKFKYTILAIFALSLSVLLGGCPAAASDGAAELAKVSPGSDFCDVTGDGAPDYITMYGSRLPDSIYIEKVSITVKDGKTGETVVFSPETDEGYGPSMLVCDFTGDGVCEIMVALSDGGTGGYVNYYIYSLAGLEPELIFSSDGFNEEYSYTVTYQDNYKVLIENQSGGKYVLDVEYKIAENQFYAEDIYDANGKLNIAETGSVGYTTGIRPVIAGNGGISMIVVEQRIIGPWNADTLGWLQSYLIWNDGGFSVQYQLIAAGWTETE